MPPSPSIPNSDERRRNTGKFTNGNFAVTKEAEPTANKFNPVAEQQNLNAVYRDSSYNFSKDDDDFDFLMSGSPSPQRSPPLSIVAESPNNYGMLTPKEVTVFFHDEVVEPRPIRHRSNSSTSFRSCGVGGGGGGEEVVVCSGNASFKKKSNWMRTKTKSRLTDLPENNDKRSGRLSKSRNSVSEFEEEDPFLDDDLPDEYKQLRYSKWTILQLFSLILILGALIGTLTIPYYKHKKLYDLVLWKWEVMLLVLICGRLVSGWAIKLLVTLIERNFILRKRVLYFVYGLRKAVQNCLWFGLVLIAWQCIFHKKVDKLTDGKVLPYVTKIWVCLLVGTVVWLLKTVLVKTLAFSFHVSTYFDRIQESLFNQYVIETLSGPPVIEIQQEREEDERLIVEVQKLQNAGATLTPDLKANIFKKIRSGRLIGTPRSSTPMAGKSGKTSEVNTPKSEEGITIDHLHRLNQKNISAWNMKRLMNIVRTGVLSTLDEQLGPSKCDDDESAVQITNEKQAKVAAKQIFCNVTKQGSKRVYLADLIRFLRDDEAVKAIRLLDSEGETKGISKGVLKNWVVNVFRERRALALSLNDTKTAVKRLHQMFNLGVGILIIVIWLLILKVATQQFFIFLSSQLLLVVFVFGNTCKTTFEAIVFLFVMHPFDVGDRVEVDQVQMVVEEMNILTTVFLRFDNLKIIYPNSVLATKLIANYYRSPDMGDAVDFCVHVSTPIEKISLMKERITSYIERKSDHWYPEPMIVLRDVEDMNRLKISIWLSHRINFQDMGERWQRRALLVEEMIKVFRDLDIEYRMLPVDVNVRNMPTVASNRLPSTWTSCAN